LIRPGLVTAFTALADNFPIALIFPHLFPHSKSHTGGNLRTNEDPNHSQSHI
jgi:hypothetical protein